MKSVGLKRHKWCLVCTNNCGLVLLHYYYYMWEGGHEKMWEGGQERKPTQ